MKRLRTSTCSSCSGASSARARTKLAATGLPLGREARRISRLIIGVIDAFSQIRSSKGVRSLMVHQRVRLRDVEDSAGVGCVLDGVVGNQDKLAGLDRCLISQD